MSYHTGDYIDKMISFPPSIPKKVQATPRLEPKRPRQDDRTRAIETLICHRSFALSSIYPLDSSIVGQLQIIPSFRQYGHVEITNIALEADI